MLIFKRASLVLSATVVSVLCMAGAALAQTQTPEQVVGGAAASLRDSLLSVATTVLPYAAVILAVTIGWRFARKFIRG